MILVSENIKNISLKRATMKIWTSGFVVGVEMMWRVQWDVETCSQNYRPMPHSCYEKLYLVLDDQVSDRPERLTREDADVIAHGVIEVEVDSIVDPDHVRVSTSESRYILSSDVKRFDRLHRRGPHLNVQVGEWKKYVINVKLLYLFPIFFIILFFLLSFLVDILFYDKELFLASNYQNTQYVRALLLQNELVNARYLHRNEPFTNTKWEYVFIFFFCLFS